jgi:hypothetical protein
MSSTISWHPIPDRRLCAARFISPITGAKSNDCSRRWVVDSIIGEGYEAVIEWTMFHKPKPGGARVALRGAEFYRFANGRIAEIRAYYNQLDRSTELEGFDYPMRGYSQLGREQSALHSSPRETERSNDSHK